VSKFLLTHWNLIYSDDIEDRQRIRSVMIYTFPSELTDKIFLGLEHTVQEAQRETWLEGRVAIQVSELFAPLIMQFDRTKSAFDRWNSQNLYLEAKIIREGNLMARDILMTKANLIPNDLLPHANRLVEHYDKWLEEFERVRGGESPDLTKPFVFTGPQGFPFPRESEQAFRNRFQELTKKLAENN
jgi:hypothetical protein